MEDLLAGLNEAQCEAVTSTEGFVRVLAGAGSGKTRALTHRFLWMVEELGIMPGHILAVTFTNKSAAEMRQRIHSLVGDGDTGYICTFHGFCVSVLQEDSYAVQYPKSFLVLDNADIDAMLETIYDERKLTLRDKTFKQARDMIEMQKLFNRLEYYLDLIALSPEELYEKYQKAVSVDDIIFYGYLYQQKKCFGLDYNDLIKFTLYIFHINHDIRQKWQERLEYIMIDEFQDIDSLQYNLMEVLAGFHKNLFVVGDPDQTIYTWRGADGRYLMDFDSHHAGTKTIMMMQNYRSTPQILNVVNSLIEKNHDRIKKTLQPVHDNGKTVTAHHALTVEKESEWLAAKIEKLHTMGRKYSDIAVLYRAHYVTRQVEEALLKNNIPYHIYSGVPFFARKEIKDALSYLRFIVYHDDLSFERIVNVPKRNIGKRRMSFLKAYSEEHRISLYQALIEKKDDAVFKGTKAQQLIELAESFTSRAELSISEVLEKVLDDSGYEAMLRTEGSQERLDNLAEFKQSVRAYEVNCGEEATLEYYLSHVALFTNQDIEDKRECVKLMTIHAAKGLEFPVVFLCGMNEGVFPSRKIRTLQGMEEERRLAFVAMTRAEEELYLTEGEGIHFNGGVLYPSRFVLDIDPQLIEWDLKPPTEQLINEAKKFVASQKQRMLGIKNKPSVQAGQRIEHRIFGLGTVESINEDNQSYRIKFDDMDTPRDVSWKIALKIL